MFDIARINCRLYSGGISCVFESSTIQRLLPGLRLPETAYYCSGTVTTLITSQTFLATRITLMDPAVRLDNLSNLTVGRLAGFQHSSVIIYLAVISLVHRRRENLRRSVIILKCESSFTLRFN